MTINKKYKESLLFLNILKSKEKQFSMTVEVIIGSLPVIMLVCSHYQGLIGERREKEDVTAYPGVISISTCISLYNCITF